jgi:hypothetical protein
MLFFLDSDLNGEDNQWEPLEPYLTLFFTVEIFQKIINQRLIFGEHQLNLKLIQIKIKYCF